jgi:hypothetical protein
MTAMLSITSSMAAVLFNEGCSVTYGSSPLAWGYLMWWIVDTAARVTLWPLRDRARLWNMLLMYKNLSNILLLASVPLCPSRVALHLRMLRVGADVPCICACAVWVLTARPLCAGTALTLLISDAAIGASTAAPSITAAVSALLLAPVMAPRWSTSLVEACTVPLALLAVLVFWIIIPIAGSSAVSSFPASDLSSCALIQLVPV